jgi:hypothetical protein
MTETERPIPQQSVNEVCFYDHYECQACPPQSTSTAHLSRFNRAVIDALGDVHITLMRDPEYLTVWDVGVQTYSADTPPGGSWDIEHAARVGVPSYMPPNCPEWLWIAYSALGDMCTHFMDLHDPTGVEGERP